VCERAGERVPWRSFDHRLRFQPKQTDHRRDTPVCASTSNPACITRAHHISPCLFLSDHQPQTLPAYLTLLRFCLLTNLRHYPHTSPSPLLSAHQPQTRPAYLPFSASVCSPTSDTTRIPPLVCFCLLTNIILPACMHVCVHPSHPNAPVSPERRTSAIARPWPPTLAEQQASDHVLVRLNRVVASAVAEQSNTSQVDVPTSLWSSQVKWNDWREAAQALEDLRLTTTALIKVREPVCILPSRFYFS
jgi:hypothetical protein